MLGNYSLVLFDPYIGPYQVLPLQARVDLGAMAMKGLSAFPQSSGITGTLPSRCLVLYPGYSLGESYPSAEMQSVYSATPADWVSDCKHHYCITHLRIRLEIAFI